MKRSVSNKCYKSQLKNSEDQYMASIIDMRN